ncbi:MAG TPA: imidazolonepropionase, partial [Bacteroidales bacterium]|nr:imidazolonepropionase [Bacteroidales bacterium]
MMIIITNIQQLVNVDESGRAVKVGKDMQKLNTISNAWLLIEGDEIRDYGEMNSSEFQQFINLSDVEVIDAENGMVFPSFCDSHTHLVYAGSREQEFVDKIRGLSYEEIARRGGGILNSAQLLHQTSEEQLLDQALFRLDEIIHYGTGAVEIKSGYGLNTEDELKILRVIQRLKELSPLTIKSTFLGAHAIPWEYKDAPDDYVDVIIQEMIPQVASEGLADFIDVFCDKGFFTPEQTDRILMAGMKYG